MTDEHRADAAEQDITSDAAEIVHQEASSESVTTPEETPAPRAKKPRKKKAAAVAETATQKAVEQTPAPVAEAESEDTKEEPADEEPEFTPEPRPAPKLERLQKILAQSGVASRRHAEALITEGRVQVNGQVVTVLGTKADAARDHIRVDGKLLQGSERLRYFMLNKPRGYVTTVSDPEGRPTVMEFFSKMGERLYPVGRLDFQSEGLLIVTNDGTLANGLTKAASGVEKTYLVKVAGQPSEEMIQRLREGITIERGQLGEGKVRTAPARIQQIRQGDNPWYEVVLIEGRNRELRKMFEEIGHHVEKIRRVGYGPLILDVEPGKLRELEPEELAALRRAADGKFKARRLKTTGFLPKEAGQSTEVRMAKEAIRRDKKFARPFPRDTRRDNAGWQPRERTTTPRPPARDDARASGGSGGPRFAAKPAFGDRPRPSSGPRTERPQKDFRPRPPFRGDRPPSGAKPGFDRRPPRTDARPRSDRPAFGSKPSFDRRPPRPDTKPRADRPAFGAKPGFDRRPPRTDAKPRGDRPAFGAKPGFDRRPPREGTTFRTERPTSPAKPQFDRRPPRDDAKFGGRPPQGKPFAPRGDRPAANRPPGRSPERSFGRTSEARPRFDKRPARPAGASFERERPKSGPPQHRESSAPPARGTGSARPRLEIRPVQAEDGAFEREKPRTIRPPRREGTAPAFRGAGSTRPHSKPFSNRSGKPAGGAGKSGPKSGFSGRSGSSFGSKPKPGGPSRFKPGKKRDAKPGGKRSGGPRPGGRKRS